ncbi:glycosyltransferase domain-containing protein [Haladaptatus sp. GCM10025893]|uniref:glycosyltransferase domain-containing protein n=1 Tax=Haladaptatus sp. GCM10025893 TaxID=3252659 RepID=UPI003609F80D
MSQNQKKIVVYTAIFEDYDYLHDPKVPNENIDYLCFTDNPSLKSDIWSFVLYEDNAHSPNLKNRKVKILPHKFDILQRYNYSVYIDGNIQITKDISELVDRYSCTKFACPKHYLRDCVYEEARACIEGGKGNQRRIRRQIARYKKEGFPEHYGLSANSILFRNHNDTNVQALSEAWWKELQNESGRDQLSLPYISWKLDFDYYQMEEGPRLGSEFFRLHPHLPQTKLKPFWKYWIQVRGNYESRIDYATIYFGVKGARKAKEEGALTVTNAMIKQNVLKPIYDYVLEIGDRYGVLGPNQIYKENYYQKRRHDPFRSEAHHIAKVFKYEFEPKSVVDFGCAIGAYLEPFYTDGIRVKGVEGNNAAIEHAVIPSELIEIHDLRERFSTEELYDLVISIEVAEHISERYADNFVDTLTTAGSTVVLTAAPPEQGERITSTNSLEDTGNLSSKREGLFTIVILEIDYVSV